MEYHAGPEIILNPIKMGTIFSKSKYVKDDIMLLKSLYSSKRLPQNSLFGIALNTMIGVFKIIHQDGFYYCCRVVSSNHNIIISNIQYPITNMKHVPCTLECNMDYIIDIKTISKLK